MTGPKIPKSEISEPGIHLHRKPQPLVTAYDTPAAGAKVKATLVFAHGAGASSQSDFMVHMSEALCRVGFQIFRFDFAYMARTIREGKRRPPDRMPSLIAQFAEMVEEAQAYKGTAPLLIGGKSMGGRAASLLAFQSPERVDGWLAFGYPFRPPVRKRDVPESAAKMEKPNLDRTAHLPLVKIPGLICQGERDKFGGRAYIEDHPVPESISLAWAPDGDHSLTPRKKSGHSLEETMAACACACAKFAEKCAGP